MNVSFEDPTTGKTLPREAIIFYQDFAVHVPMVKRNGQMVYGTPQQLQLSELRRMLATLDYGFVPSRFLQEHVLAYDESRTIWYTKAKDQVLYFKTKDDPALQAISGQVFPQPALLFKASQGQLQVFALASNDRPTPDTVLHVAPYYNVSGAGNVCIGSTPLPLILHPDNTDAWVEAFYSSSFTHGNQHRLHNHGGSHAEMWKDVQQKGHFPAEHLLPTKHTLGDLLK